MKKFVIAFVVMAAARAQAQDKPKPSPFTFSGYAEVYYTFDFGKPQNGNRPSFVYSHNRHNEFNLNVGLLKAGYQTNSVRANLALATGTYMNANYASEPGVLKNIFEANVGVKISKTDNLWLDAGIFASHIGFESAIGKDCWNLTRGILADNSPYFESGMKLTYTSKNEKWLISGLFLNGWQRIQRVPGNSTPAFGHQVTFKPTNTITLNSSSFIGNDKPDSARQMRFFHNLYGIFQITEHVGVIAGFDIGAEQKFKGSSELNTWYTPNLVLRFKTSGKSFLALRGEYYNDKNGVIISTGSPNGFQTWGYSVNFDRQLNENATWRVEARGFTSRDNIFQKEDKSVPGNFFFSTALAISF